MPCSSCSRDHLAQHLEEETKARIEEERQALQYSESGIAAMQHEEERLILQLQELHAAEQEAMLTLQATNAYDPFTDGLDLSALPGSSYEGSSKGVPPVGDGRAVPATTDTNPEATTAPVAAS